MNSETRRSSTAILAIAAIVLVGVTAYSSPSSTDGENRGAGSDRRSYNIFGIHTLAFPGDDTDKHLNLAHNLVGDGGYVTQMFGPVTKETTRPTTWTVEFVRGVYSRGMLPIVRLNMPWADGYYETPPTNDGSEASGPEDYREIAVAFQAVVRELPRKEGLPLYIQILNEVNLKAEWGKGPPDPTAFGYFYVAVADAIAAIDDPRIRLLSTPLSPQSVDSAIGMAHHTFLDEMYTTVPAAVYASDALSVHTYPGPVPPSMNNHDGTQPAGNDRLTIDAYQHELDVLERHGRTDVDVFITETAYQLGNGGLTRDQQEEHIVGAYLDYWERWNEVQGVTPFILLAEQTNEWRSFEWVAPTTTVSADGVPSDPYPHYTAVAAIEKPPMRTFADIPTGLGDHNMVSKSDSVLFDAEVTASSSIELYGWLLHQINDGDSGGLGWTSEGADQDEWVIFDLGVQETISSVVLHPRGGDAEAGKFFPVSFRIETSNDGSAWTEVYRHTFSVTNQETWRVHDPFTCTLDPSATALHIRVYVTNKTNHGDRGYHVQFSEIEAF